MKKQQEIMFTTLSGRKAEVLSRVTTYNFYRWQNGELDFTFENSSTIKCLDIESGNIFYCSSMAVVGNVIDWNDYYNLPEENDYEESKRIFLNYEKEESCL